jgi:uracil-DNA glycosylase family 4
VSVRTTIVECTKCELHKVGNGPVPYRGKPSTIMVVGEAPGRQEDAVGKPFIGPAGKLLWTHLKSVGIERSAVFVANAVCCWPQGTPTKDQVYACRGNLHRQVSLCRPRHVLALGRTAAWSLGKRDVTMGQMHGTSFELAWLVPEPVTVFVTYHPAAVLRDRTMLRSWRQDLRRFAKGAQT